MYSSSSRVRFRGEACKGFRVDDCGTVVKRLLNTTEREMFKQWWVNGETFNHLQHNNATHTLDSESRAQPSTDETAGQSELMNDIHIQLKKMQCAS